MQLFLVVPEKRFPKIPVQLPVYIKILIWGKFVKVILI